MARRAEGDKANSEMGLASPVLSYQQFAIGLALFGGVILQEGMQRRMKEQRCNKRRPHDATAAGC